MKLTPIKYSLHKETESPHFTGIHLTMDDFAGGEFIEIQDLCTEAEEAKDHIRLDYKELHEIYQQLDALGKFDKFTI